MEELQNPAVHVSGERGILVKVVLPEDAQDLYEEPLEELRRLADTAGVVVCDELLQKRSKPDGRAYLGKGKIEELKQLVDRHDADVVICDNELKPHQVKNLEEDLCVKVIDRTELILDIFAYHARTHQAKLQVELAQMQYSLPRLKRMWTHLSRIKAGVGMRGPGEKQLESDRRIAQKRINDLKRELREIDLRRQRQAGSREDVFCVSLVGYTNAGKSTLMNAMTGADVLVQDQLFATLDTRTRVADLGDGKSVILSDTVGFIRNLPHHLVASFRATLEETINADLLMHVIDASHPSCHAHIEAVNGVLETLGASGKDTLYVFNKVDRLEDKTMLTILQKEFPRSVAVSARTGDGIDDLKRTIREIVVSFSEDITVECDAGNGKLLAYMMEQGELRSQEYDGMLVRSVITIPGRFLYKVEQLGGRIVETES